MELFEERPDVALDRQIFRGAAAAAAIGAAMLLWQVYRDPNGLQTLRFLAFFCLLALAGYFGWTAHGFSSVLYTITDGTLWLRYRLGQVEVPLDEIIHVARWRHRWLWSGNLEADLGVEEAGFIPPGLFLGNRLAWVVVYRAQDGDRHALAIRPSARLLVALKNRTWNSRVLGG